MTTYLISSLLWVSFPLSVLYTSVWQGLVLRFWSLSHTPDDSSPCVPLLSITVPLPWFPHLLCWASIFPLKLHMANLTCALLLKLFYTLTFPFLLMATLLSCSSRPTFCSFFCLKSILSTFHLQALFNLFLFLRSYWHPQRISSCYLSPSLLNTLATTPRAHYFLMLEPMTAPQCRSAWAIASPQRCRQLFLVCPSRNLLFLPCWPCAIIPCPDSRAALVPLYLHSRSSPPESGAITCWSHFYSFKTHFVAPFSLSPLITSFSASV